MNMLILSLHIIAAIFTTGAIAAVIFSAYARHESRAYMTMLVSFAATALSGVALMFVTAGALGRFCAMMSAYAVAVVVARAYYRKKTFSSASL